MFNLFMATLIAVSSAWGAAKFRGPIGVLACESLLATTLERTTNAEANFTLRTLRQQLGESQASLPNKTWAPSYVGKLTMATPKQRRDLNAFAAGLQSSLMENSGLTRALFVRELRGASVISAAALAQDQEMAALLPAYAAAVKRSRRDLPDILKSRLANPLHYTAFTSLNLGAIADLANLDQVSWCLSLPYLAATLIYDTTTLGLSVSSLHLRSQNGYARVRQTLKQILARDTETDFLTFTTDHYTLPRRLSKLFTDKNAFTAEERAHVLAYTQSGPVAAWTAYQDAVEVREYYFDNLLFYDQVAREPVWLSLVRLSRGP